MSNSSNNRDGMPFEFERPIRRFEDIPDIVTKEIPEVEYIVPSIGIARNTVTLWTGTDGVGKSFLVERMAVAIARGEEFLGMKCREIPVLYLDYENPDSVVQKRIRPMTDWQPIPNLRIWGAWRGQQQPPRVADALLLAITKEAKPVIVIDPLRLYHDGEENDSTAMAAVMQDIRLLAVEGSGVIALHHPAKAEGSTGRGSSAIRAHCDMACVQTFQAGPELITLRVDKNRFGHKYAFDIQPDFEVGEFTLTESTEVIRAREEIDRTDQTILADPGITQAALCRVIGGRKAHALEVIRKGLGTRWYAKRGGNNSVQYFSCSAKAVKLLFPKDGTTGTAEPFPTPDVSCSPVPSLRRGEQGNN